MDQARSPASGRPITLWLTALPGAGKTTLALALQRKLNTSNRLCYVLDGDRLRHGINGDLGFSPEDRHENIRRIAEVAQLFNDAGLISIVAVVSPYSADRAMARGIIGPAYREVYLSTPLEVCERRDPKGMYARARRGEIPAFTGISAPYEPPEMADLTLDTSRLSIEACVEHLLELASGPEATLLHRASTAS